MCLSNESGPFAWDFCYLTRVERIAEYAPGGYHPVHIGDILNNRYRIVHKLGHGGYSTVWLTRDDQDRTYKAVKIIVASASGQRLESVILRHLNEKPAVEPFSTSSLVPTLFDEFMIKGPNGEHRCLVSEAAGCSVSGSREASELHHFSLNVARSIAAQIILGVRFIHSRGVVHGDLHPGNILFQLPEIDDLTLDELYQRIGKPDPQPVFRKDGSTLGNEYPSYQVGEAEIFTACEDFTPETCSVRFCDFGEAFFPAKTTRHKLHTPHRHAPPESLIDTLSLPIGPPADIWTLACTVFEICGSQSLFCRFMPDLVAEIVGALGLDEMPQDWLDAWTDRQKFIEEDGSWKEGHEPRPLSQRIVTMRDEGAGQLSLAERRLFTDMLASMLRFRPEERVTAEELVRCEWMQQWGLPALQKSIV